LALEYNYLMNNRLGYIHWVVVILIAVIAVGLVGVAWYYKDNKTEENTPNLSETNISISRGSENTNAAIQDIDDHGCDVPQGFYWCELSQTCIDHAVEDCVITTSNASVASALNDAVIPLEPITDSHPISYIGDFNIPTSWKEYTDDISGFTFRYPPDWSVLEPSSEEIGLQIAPPNVSEREDSLRNNLQILTVDGGYAKDDLSNIETLVINGNYAQVATYVNQGGTTELHTYVPNGDSHFVLKWASEKEAQYSEYRRIRSTFKLDINTVSQWPVYDNNFGIFALTFPEEWKGYSYKDTSGAYYEITFAKKIVETQETVSFMIVEWVGDSSYLFPGYNWVNGYIGRFGYSMSNKPNGSQALKVWEQIPEIVASLTGGNN